MVFDYLCTQFWSKDRVNRPRKHAEEKVLPLGDGVSLSEISEIGSQLGHTTLIRESATKSVAKVGSLWL